MKFVRVIGMLGRLLVGAGVLLLFYTTYLLWGTSVETNRTQDKLAKTLASAPVVTQASLDTGNIPPAKPTGPVKLGDPLWQLVIPKIGLNSVVVQGVEEEELKKGPGHFVDSPWPGESGNVPISGHRTTFGAPFFRLNELEAGDEINIESGGARYRYRVDSKEIVDPSRVDVVENHGRDEITLTTCHPRFSAAQRLIVHGAYIGPELIQTAAPETGTPKNVVAKGDPTLIPHAPPAIPRDAMVLALIALASFLAAMALSTRLRSAALWTVVVLVAAAGLWAGVFPQILRLMPANY